MHLSLVSSENNSHCLETFTTNATSCIIRSAVMPYYSTASRRKRRIVMKEKLDCVPFPLEPIAAILKYFTIINMDLSCGSRNWGGKMYTFMAIHVNIMCYASPLFWHCAPFCSVSPSFSHPGSAPDACPFLKVHCICEMVQKACEI